MLQCVAVWCSVVQCGDMYYKNLSCVVVCCSVLQHVRGTHNNNGGQRVAVRCSVLGCVAVSCSVVQCAVGWYSVAVYCSVQDALTTS